MDSEFGAFNIARIRTTKMSASRDPNFPDSCTREKPGFCLPKQPGFRARNSVCFLEFFVYLCNAIAIAKHILPLPCDSSPFGHT